MARSPRLKVYRARMGFFESVVAAPSQKAALEAWGMRQDLFHEGMASATDDPQAVEAAQAHPGVVLQRPVGSTGPFEPSSHASALPSVPSAPKRPKPEASRPEPDRSKLMAAEQALARLDAEQASELEEIEREREDLNRRLKALDARELDFRRDLDTRRRGLQQDLERARKAYERAGGRL